MNAVIVPVKDPKHSKTRLSSAFSPADRQRLAAVMFEDVARALLRLEGAAVFVVSSFLPACDRAKALGLDVLHEVGQISESDSVDRASRILELRGFTHVLRVPADIPLVTPPDIQALIARSIETPGVLLVPSAGGSGTNAILRTPPTLFPSHFGPDSLSLHLAEARLLGVHPIVVENPRIALDIDDPSDLASLLARGSDTRTGALLARLGVDHTAGAG